MAKNKIIDIKGTEIIIVNHANNNDYISLTDIAKYKDKEHTDDLIKYWMRNRNTIELLGFWEKCIIWILNPSNSTGLEIRQD